MPLEILNNIPTWLSSPLLFDSVIETLAIGLCINNKITEINTGEKLLATLLEGDMISSLHIKKK